MQFNRYLELLDADVSRIESLGPRRRVAAPAPYCPGWLVRGVVIHVAVV